MYHKIKNIPMDVCTAEQKIAYNLAFSYGYYYRETYNNMQTEFQKSVIIPIASREMIKFYKQGYNYNPNKYDEDMIFSALMAGLENYFNGKSILTTYKEIGETFPARYLNK